MSKYDEKAREIMKVITLAHRDIKFVEGIAQIESALQQVEDETIERCADAIKIYLGEDGTETMGVAIQIAQTLRALKTKGGENPCTSH